MTRSAALYGALLVALGLVVFCWKTLGYGVPIRPSHPEGLWNVEIEVTARGFGEPGSVRAAIPQTRTGQTIFDEHAGRDRVSFTLRDEPDVRLGVWSGRYEGVHHLVYGFRVQLQETVTPLRPPPTAEVPPEIAEGYLVPTGTFPSDSDEVQDLLLRLRLPDRADTPGRLRALHVFVSDEITTLPQAGGDALLTLSRREGSPLGTERLLVTLLRAAGIPARSVNGLELREDRYPEPRVWTEAWIDEEWVPLSPSGDFFARRPRDYLVLHTSEGRAISGTGVRAIAHRFQALRARLDPDEIALMMAPENPVLSRVSLYRLGVGMQSNLRLLLLLPLGALMTALFRNVVGIPTFGTFMPALIALALRTTSLAGGLALVGTVMAVGIVGRLLLGRLRLLMVPRLSALLCLVVLTVTAMSLIATDLGASALFGGTVLPIVILTMLIERFSVGVEEEGMRKALVRSGWSVLVAMAIYPAFRSETVEQLMFSFPELVLTIMGLLVLLGGYTGYRFADLLRFRDLIAAKEGRS